MAPTEKWQYGASQRRFSNTLQLCRMKIRPGSRFVTILLQPPLVVNGCAVHNVWICSGSEGGILQPLPASDTLTKTFLLTSSPPSQLGGCGPEMIILVESLRLAA